MKRMYNERNSLTYWHKNNPRYVGILLKSINQSFLIKNITIQWMWLFSSYNPWAYKLFIWPKHFTYMNTIQRRKKQTLELQRLWWNTVYLKKKVKENIKFILKKSNPD